MDKKLTDNEIVKALEYCSNPNNTCDKCILFNAKDDSCQCANNLRLQAFDLINRQQAEILNLTSDLTSLQNDLTSAKAEIERLKKEVAYWETEMKEARADIDQAVTEAYKVFAEQVQGEIDDAIHSNYNAKEERQEKCKRFGIPIAPEDSFLMYCDGKIHALSGLQSFIDNLLKEKAGEDG